MDAETRVALEWAVTEALFQQQRYQRTEDRKWYDGIRAALQALLDEKGGGGHERCSSSESLASDAVQVAGAASTAPPDSAAKIAAWLTEIADSQACTRNVSAELRAIAARVEALGLEPGERETVRRAVHRIHGMLEYLKDQPGTQPIKWLEDELAALAPIAERKP